MGRAPCCEKVGLKKGPWSAEEDRILCEFVQRNGHSNWRALPKQAGLLRCGKSCRLRWINYLRPDIKRGNFTKDEEDTIIQLHEMVGNRWSAIAAKLPGRTDNEIKNVWHTNLKKRLPKYQPSMDTKPTKKQQLKIKTTVKSENPYVALTSASTNPVDSNTTSSTCTTNTNTNDSSSNSFRENFQPNSPQQSSSDVTSSIMQIPYDLDYDMGSFLSDHSFPVIDETFWSLNNDTNSMNVPSIAGEYDSTFQVSLDDNSISYNHFYNEHDSDDIVRDNSIDFWHDIFVKAGGSSELSKF